MIFWKTLLAYLPRLYQTEKEAHVKTIFLDKERTAKMGNTSITQGQLEYIGTLIERCEDRGIELPGEVYGYEELSILEAAELIDTLKLELGW